MEKLRSANGALFALAAKRAKNGKKEEKKEEPRSCQPVVQYKSLAKIPVFKYKSSGLGSYMPSSPQTRHSSNYPWTAALANTLSSFFGHKSFNPLQEPIINSILLGEDQVVVLPTGSGKSLTYQLPALMSPGITLVIQPLISLMNDQASKLQALGIKAVEFNSNLNSQQQTQELQRLESDPDIRIVFSSPEMLSKSGKFMESLQKLNDVHRLTRLAIDEAHCICQWGSDFRPSYLKISIFRDRFPSVPIVALSASATKEMVVDISKNLKLRDPVLFSQGYNRPNLYYEVRKKTASINSDIGNFIVAKHEKDCGLIYCNFIKECETLTKVLRYTYKINVEAYYGEMPNERKVEVYNRWICGEINVIVGTLAFGLGIDKKDVRFVVHYSIPESIELYYQETGRAGRDGVSSNCILYYLYDDKLKLESLLNKNKISDCYKMIEYCENSFTCRRKVILSYLGEDFPSDHCNKMCDNCIHSKDSKEIDISSYAKTLLHDIAKDYPGLSTMAQVLEVSSGSNSRSLKSLTGIPSFGLLKKWSRKNRERLLRMMIFKRILEEVRVKVSYNAVGYYKLHPGENSRKLMGGQMKLTILVKKEENLEGLKSENKAKGDKKGEIEGNVEKSGVGHGETGRDLRVSEYEKGFSLDLNSLDKEVIENFFVKRELGEWDGTGKQVKK